MNRSEQDKAIALTLPDEKLDFPADHPLLGKEVMERFEKIAAGYRDVLRKAKRDAIDRRKDLTENQKDAEKVEADASVMLQGDVNPFRYVKYAFDKHGNLALGRPKGRRKPHRHPLAQWLAQQTQVNVTAAYEAIAAKAKAEEREPTPQEFIGAIQESVRKARNKIARIRKAKRKARRDQQKLSRRINRGHAAGRKFNRRTR